LANLSVETTINGRDVMSEFDADKTALAAQYMG